MRLRFSGLSLIGLIAPGALGFGCGPEPRAPDDVPTSTANNASTSAAAESQTNSVSCEGGCDSDAPPETADTGVAFIPDPTTGMCSLGVQDCPAGEKCNVWGSEDAGLDSVGCFPLAEIPDEVGEPCVWGDSYFDGLDSCVAGAFCHREGLTDSGVCRSFCDSSPCGSPCTFCRAEYAGALLVCLPFCSPFAGCLQADFGCYPFEEGGGFGCFPAGDRARGEACDPTQISECSGGLFCAPGARVPGCAEEGCCAELCSTRAAESCAEPNLECEPDLFSGLSCAIEIGACVDPP